MKVRRPFSTRTAGSAAPLNPYTVESLNRNSTSHRRSPDSTIQRSNAPTLPYVSRFTFYRSPRVSRFTFQDARSSRSTIQPFNDSTLRQRGIALVITLILLAVITFMAITFLVVSNAGRQNVNTSTEQIAARSMLDAGLEQANASLIAGMIAYTNPTLSLMVSTNYDTHAFVKGNGYFTNVSYTYGNGQPLTPRDNLQNLNNMLYLPRVPVFITNAVYRSNSFPFYLDLNRNGRYDTNGWQPVLNTNGGYYDLTGKPTTIFNPTNVLMANMPGDPEWVGVFERGFYNPVQLLGAGRPPTGNFLPGFGHSPTNHAIGRYAYVVIPVSSTLDLNNIYNYGKDLDTANMQVGTDSYLRNQGAGSWELNLAAFLGDLNTNYWPSPYNYLGMDLLKANGGVAFEDALALLRYRYAGTVKPGLSPAGIYPLDVLVDNNRIGGLSKDGIDLFASGPLMTNFWPVTERDGSRISGRVGFPGSDSTNRWWDPQDLFDPAKTKLNINTNPLGVCDRLYLAGLQKDSYNSGTFYRLLSQMGFDSAPESPKLNLNYANVDAKGNIVPDMVTNLSPWIPEQFFTNAVVRMLTNQFTDMTPTNPYCQTNFVVNNHLQIMIYPTNHYTPAVHRLLQLAANIFDAGNMNGSPTNIFPNGLPTVFRPILHDSGASGRGQRGIFIVGYQEVTTMATVTNLTPYDLELTNTLSSSLGRDGTFMVYGLPFVVGAKKGFPNFNEYAMLNDFTVSRKLEFHRNAVGGPIVRTNQTYSLTISNALGLEAWNSYSTAYSQPIQLRVAADVILSMTNSAGVVRGPLVTFTNFGTISNMSTWAGYTGGRGPAFVVPLMTNYFALPTSDYDFGQNRLITNGVPLDPPNRFPVPHWFVNLRCRLRVIMTDSSGRIVDYVNLAATEPTFDIADKLRNSSKDDRPADCSGTFPRQIQDVGSFFCTNRANLSPDDRIMTQGLINQIGACMSPGLQDDDLWMNYNSTVQDKVGSTLNFTAQITGSDTRQVDFAAPFSPKQYIHHNISWQVNDPLVHYTVPDLTDLLADPKTSAPFTYGKLNSSSPFNDLAGTKAGGSQVNPLNPHYRPWMGNPYAGSDTPLVPTRTNIYAKDPLVYRSDDWQFVTNKFPTVSWLGRVHRGTPWQTVYLKAPPATTSLTWYAWSGHVVTNWYSATNVLSAYTVLADYAYSDPTNDYRIIDLFTTALNDNASRGQLSVNQTNLAAWSAVLAGCIVNANTNTAVTTNIGFIQPAGVYNALDPNSYTPLVKIVAGIDRTRAKQPGGRFQRLGDILQTPELSANPEMTAHSPYVIPSLTQVSDAVYERIPQEILSLLRNDEPRYIVYAFGQALKPAPNSVITSPGNDFGLCTNYQITAEAAARAVVHLEGPANNPHIIVDSYNILPPY
jgi:hypothetical protein